MDEGQAVPLSPPHVERRGGFLLAGFRRRHAVGGALDDILQSVHNQWLSFRPRMADVPQRTDACSYGVLLRVHEGDIGFDYFCGLKVPDAAGLPEDFDTLVVAPLTYAIFRHTGPSSLLVGTYFTIFGKALPEAGLVPADGASGAPDFVECFDTLYDIKTELGGPVIMVPLKD